MGTKTETPGRVTELSRASRWGPGYSPKALLDKTLAEIEKVNDIVIMVRYNKTSNVDDTYNILSSTMPLHELLGFIELSKPLSVSARCLGVDDGGEAS